jgi:hypothetical protein
VPGQLQVAPNAAEDLHQKVLQLQSQLPLLKQQQQQAASAASR